MTLITISFSIPINYSIAQNQVQVYPPDSKPYGLSYGEWSAKWWQWIYSISGDSNPLDDPNGKNCMQKQSGPVWFLAGTRGGSADRTCTIPSGKAIMFPIFNAVCDYKTNPMLKSEEELKKCASDGKYFDHVSVDALVDGKPIQNLEQFKVFSPLFNFTSSTGNKLGIPPGTDDQAVSYGYYNILKPLSAGNHEIHFKGLLTDFTDTATTNFYTDVTYHITVT